ncbi:SulP family inorganic anion transporter [Dawidia cretensis]|uniref:SulP family inorganic anion transporter n=1 Tax=Dawidia cretensis TaxID=2782350 RepID=UPI00293D978E|nr:SulP family inorganic anion transporter [Dawidia cretensis]
MSGLTVAMTMIPESLSFAILAGLSPLTGLYAAFLTGLVTAVLGGRPRMVSGGTGATEPPGLPAQPFGRCWAWPR